MYNQKGNIDENALLTKLSGSNILDGFKNEMKKKIDDLAATASKNDLAM